MRQRLGSNRHRYMQIEIPWRVKLEEELTSMMFKDVLLAL